MNGTKPWYQSLGVLGSGAALLSAVLSFFKFHVDAQLLKDLSDWFLQVVTIVGAAVALWGRLRATRKIGTPPAFDATVNLLLLGAFLALLAFAAPGCSAFQHVQPPQAAYVAADRATYEAVGKEYADYYHGDPLLSLDEKARRDRTMRSWLMRIERGEKAIAATPPLARTPDAPQTQPTPADTQPATGDTQPPAESIDP
jgi:hypothetical protein